MRSIFFMIIATTASFFAAAQKTVPANETTKEKLTRELAEAYRTQMEPKLQKGFTLEKGDDTRKLIEYFNSNGDLWKKKEAIYGNRYNQKPIVFESQAGESDRIALLKGIPTPLFPQPALQADPRRNENYAKKVERAQEDARREAQEIANSTQLAKLHAQGGDEAVKKMYEDKANQNPFVAQMGGTEALQKMSEQERKEAAMKMVSNQTGGYTPEQIQKMSPEQKQQLARQMAANKSGTNEVGAAFTREMMANEKYRKQYESMSDEEKQAEYKKFEDRYYGNTPRPANADVKSKSYDADAAEAQEIFRIQQFSQQLYKQMQDDALPIDNLVKQNQQMAAERMAAISKWYQAAEEALPVVSDSEYGPRKDGIEKLDFIRQLLVYEVEREKIAIECEVWEKKVRMHVDAFKKLDDFVATYRKKTNLSDRMKWELANAVAGGYAAILELNREAGFLTNSAASTQYTYNCQVLRNCVDPRQAKY